MTCTSKRTSFRRLWTAQGAGTLLVVALLSGCAHTLGEAPTDLELRNDGAPESRAHLYDEYRVSYSDGTFSRPTTSRAYERIADATSDAALSYLESESEALDALSTIPVALDRFTHSASYYSAILLLSLLSTTTIGVAAGVNGVLLQNTSFTTPTEILSSTLLIGVYAALGVLAGVVFAGPLMLIAEISAKSLIRTVASRDYRNAANAYNSALSARIERMAEPALKASSPERLPLDEKPVIDAPRDDVDELAPAPPSDQPSVDEVVPPTAADPTGT